LNANFDFQNSLNANREAFITALHGMHTRSSDENSVRLSIHLSVTRVHCDKTTYNVRKISSPSSSLLLLAKTIAHPAAWSVDDS